MSPSSGSRPTGAPVPPLRVFIVDDHPLFQILQPVGNFRALFESLLLGILQDQFAHEDERVLDVVLKGHAELWATQEERDAIYADPDASEEDYVRAAKALAVLRGRDFVVPQDLKDLSARVLGHRIILSSDARVHGQTEEAVIARLLEGVPVPGA